MVKFALSLPTHLSMDELVEQAFLAQVNGFDYVLMPDHLFSLRGKAMLNKWQVLAVIAHLVPIGVGTMVANIYRDKPETMIQYVKTLKEIARKKDVVVGLGRGTNYDTPEILRSNDAEERMAMILKMLPSDVMKIVAARGRKMKGIACDFADGWMPRHGLTFSEYRAERRKVEKQCAINSAFMYCADVPVIFNKTDEVMKSLAYRKMFQENYFFYSNMTVEDRENMEDIVGLMNYTKLEKTAVIGDVDRVIEGIREYVAEGTDFFSIRLYDNEFEKFKEVIDAFHI